MFVRKNAFRELLELTFIEIFSLIVFCFSKNSLIQSIKFSKNFSILMLHFDFEEKNI